jgi:NAD(P)-dependent dehydrogenase (short-subunit alcohol dehydrogenase family)
MTDMRGKTVVVTGATDGVGKEAALRLAEAGASLVLVSRNPEKGQAVVASLQRQAHNENIQFLQADLSRRADVRRVAADIRARCDRLDVLLNNAGAIFMRRAESADGIEMTLALNHLNYFLLTHELLGQLKASAPARIVNVASAAHRRGGIDFDDLEGGKSYAGWRAYSQSKLANILFTYELSRRLGGTGVTANALHPGFVRTRFGSNNSLLAKIGIAIAMRVSGISVGAGGKTSVYLATSPDVDGATGGYYDQCSPVRSSAISYDEAVAARLWEISAGMTGISG